MPGPMRPLDPYPPALLDRRSVDRGDAGALQRWWDHPGARAVAVHDGSIAVRGEDPQESAASLGDLPEQLREAPASQRALLGIDPSGSPWWLIMPGAAEALPGIRWAGLREIGPHASALHIEVLMTAVALQAWHARHGFCPSCGVRCQTVEGGWVRRCSAEGTEHYPRTDPAIIVLVIDASDRALLGRQTRWPAAWRSALAGFVEPGEAAESAVRREVAEEVGLRLDTVHYVGSQPWPFPGSLMLGFHARTSSLEVAVDGVEIAEAQWFTRAQLADAAGTGRIQLPPAISIARGLIERWYGSPLPGSWLRS